MTADQPGSWPTGPALLEALDAAALLVDAAGRIRYANGAATRLYAGPGDPMTGQLLVSRLRGGSGPAALAAVITQVLGGQPWRGPLEVRHADGSVHPVQARCSALDDEGAVAGLLCVLDDAAVEGGTLHEARRVGDQLTRLARVTTALVMADTVEAVSKIVVSHGADAVGATLASLSLREGEDTLRLTALRGGREGEERAWATSPMSTRTPVSDAVRTGQRLVLTGAREISRNYPVLAGVDRGERTVISLPLHGTARTVGAIGLSFPGLRTLTSAELEFFDILADTCAQALERIAAQEAAAKQGAMLAFLAEASTELASSLDYQVTLAKVAQLAVPTFADWCAIDLVVDGRLHRLAVAHVDPAKVQLARELAERYPPDAAASNGAWAVMRTGRSELIGQITDDMLVAGAVDAEQLRIARDLHLRSALTVPLVARGKVLGVITWVLAESERLYTGDDLALAEDLAKRAAVAIDNSELHSETLAAAVSLQNAVLPAVLPVMDGWQVANYYSPSGRTEVGGDFYGTVPLDGGRQAFFVGDVMGRGVKAAAAMAQMRATVRAYAAVDSTPAAVMTKLDLMFERYPTDQLVTLVYALADPARDELVVTNAGHPPPVLLRADGSVEQLPVAEGWPLTVMPQDRRQVTVPFMVGDTLMAFTDGLIERRDEDITRGQERVLHAVPRLARPDLSAALSEVVDLLRDPSRDDDVAALAARRTT